MQEVHYKELQDSMPTFIRRPDGLTWLGKHYPKGTEFPWKTIGVTFDQARNLFHASQIYHSDKLTVETKTGDGLDELNLEQLHALVDKLNARVEKNVNGNKTSFTRMKVKKSQRLDKQRGLIRSWRRGPYGQIESQ